MEILLLNITKMMLLATQGVDELREKMTIKEDKRYTDEYLEADKRSIANKIQIFFNDGSSTDAIEVEYPIGHKRRREEGNSCFRKEI